MCAHALESYLHLQLRFAARYAALSGVPLPRAVARCTNVRRRLRLTGPAHQTSWGVFLSRLARCDGPADALRVTMDALWEAPPPLPSSFGCFSYAPPDPSGVVRIHFMPEDAHRLDSPLADDALPQRKAELAALARDVRDRHGDSARQFCGQSWLYHLPAYRRLFPPAYLAGLQQVNGKLQLTGSSVWGQVIDHRQQVKPAIAERILSALTSSTWQAPWQAFPLQPLAASCSSREMFDGLLHGGSTAGRLR